MIATWQVASVAQRRHYRDKALAASEGDRRHLIRADE